MAAVPANLAAALKYGPQTQTAVRRSQYLSDALKQMQTDGGKITGGFGELGAKLLATAILQRSSRKADEATLGALKGDQDSETARLVAALRPPKPEAPPAPQIAPPVAPTPPPQPMQPPPQQAAPASAPQAAPKPAPLPAAAPQIDPNIDAIVRTVWGEARGEDATGQAAVAGVILNRAKERGMGPRDVVMQPGQFEPWGNPETRQRMAALTPESPEYQTILQNIAPALQGQNPVGGADHFYSPQAQSALRRKPPSWDNGSGQDLGRHRFFDLEQGQPQQAAQAQQAPPQPDVQMTAGPAPQGQMQVDPSLSGGGQLAPGNIDLNTRPKVTNPDGSISTVRSISIGVDGKTVLIPTVVGNRVVSDDEAIQNFRQTGQHLGVFADQRSADTYAEQLHQQQAAQYTPSAPGSSPQAVGSAAGGVPPQAPPPAAGPEWPTWKPSQQQVAYVEQLLNDPRTHDQGVQEAMKLRQKMTEPVEATVQMINNVPFYVARDPTSGAPIAAIPVPPEARTQIMSAQAAGLQSAPQGLNVQRDPLGNVKEAPGAPPAGFEAAQGGGLQPQRGGPADPMRPQAPPQGYGYAPGGVQAPIQGGPADLKNPANVMEGANRYGGMVKTIADAAMKVKQNYGAIITGYRQQNGTGDIAMTNGIQKLIDEGVVKGEDVNMQMKSNGLEGTLGGWVSYANSGGLFTPEVRQKLLKTGTDLYKSLDQTYRVRVQSLAPGFDEVYGQGSFGKYVFPDAFAQELGWAGGPSPEAGPSPPVAAPQLKPGTMEAARAEAQRRGLLPR